MNRSTVVRFANAQNAMGLIWSFASLLGMGMSTVWNTSLSNRNRRRSEVICHV
jgi:hypothetical protein